MKKTITIQAHSRPEHLERCLLHIENLVGVDQWDIYGFVDEGDELSYACYRILDSTYFVNETHISDENLGLREANKHTFDCAFNQYNSDLNLHIEEDVLVAKESLRFIEFTADQYYSNDTQVTTLWSHPDVNEQSDMAYTANRFSCWGWATTNEFYQNHLTKALSSNEGGYEGWAGSVHDYMIENNLYEIFPVMSRSKNIGFSDGYHKGINNHRLQGNPKAWTGESFDNSFNFDVVTEYPTNTAKEHEKR